MLYKPSASRLSLVGSSGWLGSTQASRLPLPLVSTTRGVQPCDVPASRVSQNIFVLIQPTMASSFWRLLLSHSVWSASSAKFKWCVPKHVSMNENCFVFETYNETWREFCTKPADVPADGLSVSYGWPV